MSTRPAGIGDLAAALARVPFEAADVHIVAGLTTINDGAHDVMRGEETQVFGALAAARRSTAAASSCPARIPNG